MTFACACGTIVTLFASTMITNTVTTISAMRTGSMGAPFVGAVPPDDLAVPVRCGHAPGTLFTRPPSFERVADDRRRAVHLQDPHRLADREALPAVLAAGGPLVGAHPDPATGDVDAAGHLRRIADERVDAVELQRGAARELLVRERADDREEQPGDDDERDELEHRGAAD